MNPTLRNHTHWQVAKNSRTRQNLPKSMAAQTHGQKESMGIQHCLKATCLNDGQVADEVVKSRPVHLRNFCRGGQVIALKSVLRLSLTLTPNKI